MSFEAWAIFALFWAVFVTTPGPNAVNCIQNGISLDFHRALVGVAAILTQATAFLLLSAMGVGALLTASPALFGVAQLIGAAVLVYFGIRTWITAKTPVALEPAQNSSVYFRALTIATINPKSFAGYLAAFSQFVQPDVPIWSQMGVIMPTALLLTTLSYVGYTAMGALIGRAALGVAFNFWVRRALALCFVFYGLLLGGLNFFGETS